MNRMMKYRLYPTSAQKRRLEETLELCRQVYNHTLAIRKDAWDERRENVRYFDTAKLLPIWKTEQPELKIVNAQVLQNVQIRVDLAFKAFFRRVKEEEGKVGYPRFRGQGRYDSFTYPQRKSVFWVTDGKLHISKIGDVKIVLHRPLEGEVKTLTITRSRNRKWYACFSCEVEVSLLPKTGRVVGIDVGLKTFATFSDGGTTDNPRFFRREEKALAKAQRRFSKCAYGTPERRKYNKVFCRIHERISNRRMDFAHQLSRRIVSTYDLIVLEKLQIQDMMDGNHRGMNKSVGDAAWHQFRQYTLFKAENAGKVCVEVDPRGTSQRCSRCGVVVKKDLSVRVHDCPHCGLRIDRDLNAALNILALGIQSVGTLNLVQTEP